MPLVISDQPISNAVATVCPRRARRDRPQTGADDGQPAPGRPPEARGTVPHGPKTADLTPRVAPVQLVRARGQLHALDVLDPPVSSPVSRHERHRRHGAHAGRRGEPPRHRIGPRRPTSAHVGRRRGAVVRPHRELPSPADSRRDPARARCALTPRSDTTRAACLTPRWARGVFSRSRPAAAPVSGGAGRPPRRRPPSTGRSCSGAAGRTARRRRRARASARGRRARSAASVRVPFDVKRMLFVPAAHVWSSK